MAGSRKAPGFLFGKSSKLCYTHLRVATAESQHLYTRADYYLIVKTTQVVTMIFNYVNPYNPTGHEKLALDTASQAFSTCSRLLGYPYLLGIDDHYLPVAGPKSAGDDLGLDSIVTGSDPIDRFLDSKREVLLNSSNGILEQIYERLSIRDSNLYEIDGRICRANSVLDQLDVFELGALPVIDKRKSFFEKELITFEQEKRFEQVACWRDVSRLQGQLLELKQQIDSQSNRQKLIND
ncbi:MAG: hypothetical protein NT028_14475 [candidate division Zixibacteria bacterium]|nr:hypothetical protein [candidate division Zixibacteria bacterium]